MTYHDSTSAITSSVADTAKHIGASIMSFFGTVSHAMMVNSTGAERVRIVQRLQAKSDAELAGLGIKRDDIVRHAFGGFIN